MARLKPLYMVTTRGARVPVKIVERLTFNGAAPRFIVKTRRASWPYAAGEVVETLAVFLDTNGRGLGPYMLRDNPRETHETDPRAWYGEG